MKKSVDSTPDPQRLRHHRTLTRFDQCKLPPLLLTYPRRSPSYDQSDVTFVPDSPLSKFIEQVIPLSPIERAKLLEETELFASIHRSAAHSGQSQIPEHLDTDLHFSAFVQAPSPHDAGLHLIELDGRREGPIERGISDDLLAVRCFFFFLSLP